MRNKKYFIEYKHAGQTSRAWRRLKNIKKSTPKKTTFEPFRFSTRGLAERQIMYEYEESNSPFIQFRVRKL